MRITYRQRTFLDKYRCVDNVATFIAQRKWKPEGTSLWYFQNGYNIVTIAEEDLISIVE